MSNICIINPPLWYYQSVPSDVIYVAQQLSDENIDYEILDLSMKSIKYFIDRNGHILSNSLRNSDIFYDFKKLNHIIYEIEENYRLISKEYSKANIKFNSYLTKNKVDKIDELEKIISDSNENVYSEFCKETIEKIDMDDWKIVYISIFHPDQIVATFTLCRLIKEKKPNVHICLYGNMEDQINTKLIFGSVNKIVKSRLKKYVDNIIFGDFFYAASYAKQYMKYSGFDERSTVDEFDKKKYTYNYKIDKHVFAKLPQSEIMPEDVINITTSQGCYWAKCAFCSIRKHWKYMRMDVENKVELLNKLQNFNRIIRFRDCCLHPKELEDMCKLILKNGIKIKWCCRARLEDGFTKEIFRLLRESGCIMISFGVESFSTNIIKDMKKGINLETAEGIIKECYENKIVVKMTAIADFPTETVEDAKINTYNLERSMKYCGDIKLNEFLVFKDSDIAKNPNKYEISIDNYNDGDISIFCDWHSLNKESKEVSNIYKRYKLKTKKKLKFISEEHMLLYIKKFGFDKFMNIITLSK